MDTRTTILYRGDPSDESSGQGGLHNKQKGGSANLQKDYSNIFDCAFGPWFGRATIPSVTDWRELKCCCGTGIEWSEVWLTKGTCFYIRVVTNYVFLMMMTMMMPTKMIPRLVLGRGGALVHYFEDRASSSGKKETVWFMKKPLMIVTGVHLDCTYSGSTFEQSKV
jgi:hypothetical protein